MRGARGSVLRWWRHREDVSLRVARGWSRTSVRRRSAAIALGGVALLGLVIGQALESLADVQAAQAGVARIVAAQTAHQDADMQHDALHANVLQAALVGRGGSGEPSAILASTRANADRMRRDLTRGDRLDLPPEARQALASVRADLEAYTALAEQQVGDLLDDRSTDLTELPRFEQLSADLEPRMAVVTDELAQARRSVDAAALAKQRTARTRLTLASGFALLGFAGLGWHLHRLGDGLAVLVGRERDVAEMLQRSLLPPDPPELPGLRLAVQYQPGAADVEVGGDWYDAVELPDGRIGLVMGDVAGHDLTAATEMGQLRSAMRAYALLGLAPHEVVARLNTYAARLERVTMATCVYAVVDERAGTMVVCNAGHVPPLLLSSDAGARYLDGDPGPPVGTLPDAGYQDDVVALGPGWTLLLYTDGLVERRDEPIDSCLDRLRELAASGPAGAAELCSYVLAGSFPQPGPRPADDVAILVVQSRPAAPPPATPPAVHRVEPSPPPAHRTAARSRA